MIDKLEIIICQSSIIEKSPRTRSYLTEASEGKGLSQYSLSLDLSPIAALLFEVRDHHHHQHHHRDYIS